MSRDSNRALGTYLAEISKFEPLDAAFEIELTQRIKQGDEQAQQELIVANLRFVVSVAKKFQGQGRPLEDLISEGNLGLIKAAVRFDETRGFKFISYAVWWVRQAILQALSEQSRLVRVPLNRQSDISRITRMAEELEHELERPALIDEIARQIAKPAHEVAQTIQISRRHQSLDSPFSGNETSSLVDILPDPATPDPDDEINRDSMKQDIATALSTLNVREREIIKLYFGIDRDQPLTLNEIGLQFNLTRERVRQIKEKALRRLQHKSRSVHLRPYL